MEMDKEKLPPGVLKKLTWTCLKPECTPITKQYVCEILLRENFLELLLSYDFMDVDQGDYSKKWKNLIRTHKIIPRHQLALTRTIYSHPAESEKVEKPEEELPPLYSGVILEYQGFELWLYMSEEEATLVFKELKKWLLNQGKS